MALLNPETDATGPVSLVALPRAVAVAASTVSHEHVIADGAAEFAAALHELDRQHRKLRTGFADHLGLTHNEYYAFMFVAEQGTTTPKELAATLRFTTGATTAMIDRLENVDLVHRMPNPDDRRSVLIEPTPHGQAQADWVINTFIRIVSDAVGSHDTLSPQQLIESVTHVTATLATATTEIA
ncbi:hypothetical protein B7R21_17230 [Subtercola boreus]|uniref:HTH marR-type domain-containing protein n=1 Tax=Subtercola boreus TaxID=120213 RepID=A0A3E0VB27_9MICO|nr:MarR family winged helix-turn-helix transcriptional regulator [Subtercola boreus]RFA07062.1 hypothetical protein B7R21_17230 [Subtercola boreus]